MSIRGVIFDLDGTLFDSTDVWTRIDVDFLAQRGFDVPPDYQKAIMALGFEEVAKYTINRFQLSESVEEVMAQWNAMAREAYENTVFLKRGAKELLLWLHSHNIKMGIATSNCASLFEPCLRNNGIAHLFHSHTETGDVSRGKEFPDVYIKEAEKLGCKSEECVVFEDIVPALKSAKCGGFLTIGVWEEKWGHTKEELEEVCDNAVGDLQEAIPILKGFLPCENTRDGVE